jgi:hypothetical protein
MESCSRPTCLRPTGRGYSARDSDVTAAVSGELPAVCIVLTQRLQRARAVSTDAVHLTTGVSDILHTLRPCSTLCAVILPDKLRSNHTKWVCSARRILRHGQHQVAHSQPQYKINTPQNIYKLLRYRSTRYRNTYTL